MGLPFTALGFPSALRASTTCTATSMLRAPSTSTTAVVSPGPAAQSCPRPSPRQISSFAQTESIVRPSTAAPVSSNAAICSATGAGSSSILRSTFSGATVTFATTRTRTDSSEVRSPTAQVIRALPGPTAVTMASFAGPATVATFSSELDHLQIWSGTDLPLFANGAACTLAVWPRTPKRSEAGWRSTRTALSHAARARRARRESERGVMGGIVLRRGAAAKGEADRDCDCDRDRDCDCDCDPDRDRDDGSRSRSRSRSRTKTRSSVWDSVEQHVHGHAGHGDVEPDGKGRAGEAAVIGEAPAQ